MTGEKVRERDIFCRHRVTSRRASLDATSLFAGYSQASGGLSGEQQVIAAPWHFPSEQAAA